ncbi:MAG: transglutaminase-like domain-containing protein [Candidatus Aminicenantes bacterium]|nr:transglutaminase-like domain-containing protein [Candidatus Aminicenantes bacterium]
MNMLLLLLYIWMPLRQESNLEVFVACRTPEIFSNYRNYNFKQEIRNDGDGLTVKIKSQSLNFKNLNHAIAGDERYLAGQDPLVRTVFEQVRRNAISIGDYLQNISIYLTNSITYAEADLPQDTVAVLLNRRAHCIGYANVAQTLLACVGIASRPINGFYLRENDAVIEPVPHRWLEIDLPGDRRVFYDPQYQDFSSRYLVTDQSVVFNRVERFLGVVVRKNKKIMDE